MVEILKNTFAASTPEARARDLVLDRLKLSQQRYAGQNQRFRELSRYYFSLSPGLRSRDNDRPTSGDSDDDYPDLFVQRSFTAVEAATPPWVFAVVGGKPPVKVYARKQEHMRNAEAVEKMIAYDWERSEVLHSSIEVAKQMFKYGTGIAKISYKFEAYEVERQYDRTDPAGFRDDGAPRTRSTRLKRKEEIVRFDGPWMDPVSVYNAIPDPYYYRIRDMRYFQIRRWADRKTLKIEDENHKRMTGKPKYKNLDKIPAVKTGHVESVYEMEYGDEMAEAMGWSGGSQLGRRYNQYVGGPATSRAGREDDDLVELIEHWDRDDRLIILANEETPILDGPNPFDDKELPFVATRCYVVDGQFWGLGYLHAIRRSQEELNSHRNLIRRQGQLNILNVWGRDPNVAGDEDVDLSPGSVNDIGLNVDGNPGIVQLYKGQPLPPEAYEIEDRIDRDMQIANAQPMWNAGPSGSDSATEATIADKNVQARVRLQALQGELTYTTEIARLFHSRRQQFLPDDGLEYRVLGSDGPNYERVDRQQLAGEFDYMTAGQHLHASEDVLRTQLEQAITIIKGDPVFLGITNVHEVWREMWKMFGFDRVERFMKPPPEDTVPAKIENQVLRHGEWIQVNVMDNHEQHIQEHQQAIGTSIDEKGMQMFMQHIEEHQKHLQLQQAAAPPQETPGAMQGGQGAVPNLENAPPTQAGLLAGVGGTGRRR